MTTPNEELRKQLQQIYKSGELYYRVISDTTDRLQSQAERIKELEGDVEYLQNDINAMCNAIPNYRWSGGAAELIAECFAERDELRAQLADAELHTKQVERGLDKATAQLAAIAAAEPVAWLYTAHDGSVQAFTNEPPHRLKELCKPVVNRAIPPVQRESMSDGALIDAVANSIAKATRPMPAQDVNAELVEAFEHHIEQTRPIERSTIALSKYKGAK